MKSDFVIFRNPYLRYRGEEFGGIAKIILKTFILNKDQYLLINNIKKIRLYSELNETEKKITNKLIEDGLLLKVDLKRAKELGFKCNQQL